MKSYALARGGPPRLTLQWKTGFQDLAITCDGDLLAVVPDPAALKDGCVVNLPEGTAITIVRRSNLFGAELHVAAEGLPLPGTPNDPITHITAAARVLTAAGAVLLGLGALGAGVEGFLLQVTAGTLTAVVGALLMVLAQLTSRGSLFALSVAAALLTVETTAVLVAPRAGFGAALGVLLRMGLLVPLGRGIVFLRSLRELPPAPDDARHLPTSWVRSASAPSLVVVGGALAGARYALVRDQPLSIGSAATADLRLPGLRPQHAVVGWTVDGVVLTTSDPAASVDGAPVSAVTLPDKARIALASGRLILEFSAAPEGQSSGERSIAT